MTEDNDFQEKRRPSWDVLHGHIVGELRRAVGTLPPIAAETARGFIDAPSALVLRALARHEETSEPEMRHRIEAGHLKPSDAVDILIGMAKRTSHYQHPSNDSGAARLDKGKTTKVRVRTRHGASYFRAGLKWGPAFLEADVTESQLKELKADGALIVEDPDKPAPVEKPRNVSDADMSPKTLFAPPELKPDEPDKAEAKPETKAEARPKK